jgi:hypothetical protein
VGREKGKKSKEKGKRSREKNIRCGVLKRLPINYEIAMKTEGKILNGNFQSAKKTH